ncbi:MAG: isochorismate synthase [Chloroflexi bacterium]|nr:isochorismate synthase [Chloroflexota bacterium]
MKPTATAASGLQLDVGRLIAPIQEGWVRAQALHRPVLASVSLPASQCWVPVAAFAAGRRLGAFRTMWARPSEGFALVGLGTAHTISVRSHHPFQRAREECLCLFDGAVLQGPEARGVGPLLLGGFRFDTAAPRSALWAAFPDGLLVLPRFLLTSKGEERWITANVLMDPQSEPGATAQRIAEEARSLGMLTLPEGEPPPVLQQEEHPQRPEWFRWVGEALQAIEADELTKVVLARTMGLSAQGGFSPEALLRRLTTAYPKCSIFAIDTGSSCFLGATPEALAYLEKGTITLSCLAGTAPRGTTPQEDDALGAALLSSPKELREHAYVVDAVLDRLNGFSQDLRWNSTPEVVRLANIQHLATFFKGCLKEPHHILQIIESLHPTPAVGGVPTQGALEAIRRLEGDRGWYGGPVGWLDQAGDGEFNVAIRSALVTDDKATLFAGSGIVQGSDAGQEFQETQLKFRSLLRVFQEG